MNRLFISIVIGFIVVVSLIVFQVTRTSASTVLLPSKLMEVPGNQTLSRIRVAGKVAAAETSYTVNPAFLLKFSIHDPGKQKGNELVPVEYAGIKPEMFAPGRDVIIDGEFRNGVLYADSLLTQCPSKYEAAAPKGSQAAPEKPLNG